MSDIKNIIASVLDVKDTPQEQEEAAAAGEGNYGNNEGSWTERVLKERPGKMDSQIRQKLTQSQKQSKEQLLLEELLEKERALKILNDKQLEREKQLSPDNMLGFLMSQKHYLTQQIEQELNSEQPNIDKILKLAKQRSELGAKQPANTGMLRGR